MEKIGSVNALAPIPLVLYSVDSSGLHVFYENESFRGLFLNGEKEYPQNLERLLSEAGFASLPAGSKSFERAFVFEGKKVTASIVENAPYGEGSVGVLSFSLSERKE